MIYYLSSVQSVIIINNIIYGSLLVQILRHHTLAKLNVRLKILNILANMQWVTTLIQSQIYVRKSKIFALEANFI